MTRDWQAWYRLYDDPRSSLSRRLAEVIAQLREDLDRRAEGPRTSVRLLSLCAGDGRDTLPVLATAEVAVSAVLVELDPELAEAARSRAELLGLTEVEVRTDDAGATIAFTDALPVDVLMLCGVFGNVHDADVERTVGALPGLLASDATVLWTRGDVMDRDPTHIAGDPSLWVRSLFTAGPFQEVAFVRPDDAGYRVGVHRFTGVPRSTEPSESGSSASSNHTRHLDTRRPPPRHAPPATSTRAARHLVRGWGARCSRGRAPGRSGLRWRP